MPLDALPSEIITKPRDIWRDDWLKWFGFRQPDADVGPDTQPYIDASCIADQLVIMSENARRIGRQIPLSEKTGDALDQFGAELDAGTGELGRLPAIGAYGSVIASTGTLGSTIFADDEATYQGLIYRVTATAMYQNGEPIPMQCKTGGPMTDRKSGDVLTWSNPRPGSYLTVAVDTEGLTGGRDAETDDEYRQRLSNALADPAAQENDAAIRRYAEDSKSHQVPVLKAFTYPGILSTGTTALCFLLKAASGGNRIPNSAQVAAVTAWVAGKLSADDALFGCPLVGVDCSVCLDLDWDPSVTGWANTPSWPYSPSAIGFQVYVSAATDATHFTLDIRTPGGGYTTVGDPVAGTVLGIWDATAQTFRRKTVLTVGGSGPWTIVCDGTNNASDLSYTPVVGQAPSPWSDSLDDVGPVVISYFDLTGPGEQVTIPIGNGMRQARSPANLPKTWPSTVSGKVASNVNLIDSVASATLNTVCTTPTSAPVGLPGVLSYLLELTDLTVYETL